MSDPKSRFGSSRSWGGRGKLPSAFTEQGVAMLSSVFEAKYDEQFSVVFQTIRESMTPPEVPARPIGFIR